MEITYAEPDKEKWFLVTWDLSNKCNYRCSYCPAMFHDGSSGWPQFDDVNSFVRELDNRLDKKICFRISGGEPTFWKHFQDFARTVKETGNYFSFLTNASRPISYFSKISEWTDGVILSYHPEYSSVNHFIDVANTFECPVVINLMLPPDDFDSTVDVGRRIWENSPAAVWPKVILDKINDWSNEEVGYTSEQKNIINNWPYLRDLDFSRIHRGPILYNGKKMTANELLLNDLNHFKGWTCWAGLDMINVDFWGGIWRANCEQGGSLGTITDFQLPSQPIICPKDKCVCLSDLYLRREC